MDKMGEEIPYDTPWKAPHAEEWDTMTFKEFIEKNAWTKIGRDFVTMSMNMCVTSGAYEGSLLWYLWYVKQCGGTRPIFSTTNGGQERKIIGGSMQISERLVDRIGSDRVLLNKPVVGITYNDKEITVRTLDGSEYKSTYLILAIPPMLQNKIHYNPSLPPLRNQMNQRCPMGSVIKCIAYYETNFWRKMGYCGSMMITGSDCPIYHTLDDTKLDGSVPAINGYHSLK
jgi:monoamine oxidase